MKYLSLDLNRLRNSDTWAEAHKTPWLGLACMNLWCSAAERDGAGLPDDDATLARLAGVTAQVWKSIKSKAMKSWRKDDGRWFHPIIEAEAKRQEMVRDGGKHGAAKRWKNKDLDSPPKAPPIGGGNSPPKSPPIKGANAPPNGSSPVESSHSSSSKKLGTASAPETPLDRLMVAMKLDHKTLHRRPSFREFPALFQEWKAQGCDPERDIWPTIERIAARKADIGSPKFFEAAVLRARDDRTAAEPTEAERWAERVAAYRSEKFWSPTWGPTPDEPGCLAPTDLVAQGRAA